MQTVFSKGRTPLTEETMLDVLAHPFVLKNGCVPDDFFINFDLAESATKKLMILAALSPLILRSHTLPGEMSNVLRRGLNRFITGSATRKDLSKIPSQAFYAGLVQQVAPEASRFIRTTRLQTVATGTRQPWAMVTKRGERAFPHITFDASINAADRELFEGSITRHKKGWYDQVQKMGIDLKSPVVPTLSVKKTTANKLNKVSLILRWSGHRETGISGNSQPP
ncbi:MAG: hypothetical protein HQM16_19130 [Deltaproteobacteria bacterium]|nr:hypothetical protein [Deltaproteobacteria bacterium]